MEPTNNDKLQNNNNKVTLAEPALLISKTPVDEAKLTLKSELVVKPEIDKGNAKKTKGSFNGSPAGLVLPTVKSGPIVEPVIDKGTDKKTKGRFRGSPADLDLRAKILKQRLDEIKSVALVRARAAQTRVKILTGVAATAEYSENVLTDILNKHIENSRDRSFLQDQGFKLDAKRADPTSPSSAVQLSLLPT